MKVLFLSAQAAHIEQQLRGESVDLMAAIPLRDDVSTDEITPVAILSYFDKRLGEFAHTGLTCTNARPIARKALQSGGFEVLVAGERYGKGSSREHSPAAERFAGVRVVFARSFERIYRQNADNIGLFTSTNFALLERVVRGEFSRFDDMIEALLVEREPLARAILRAGGLLRFGQVNLRAARSMLALDAKNQGPQTLFEKIVRHHRLDVAGTTASPQVGDGIFVRADWRFIHEYYTAMANTLLTQAIDEVKLVDPGSVVVFEDHTSYLDESPAHIKNGLIPQMQSMAAAQRDFVTHHGLRFHRTLTEREATVDSADVAGISHAVMLERYALPGQVVVGTDSHTPHSGALGCVAFGVGTTDMANAFVTGAIRLTWPGHINVVLRGLLGEGVAAKDAVLALLALPLIRAGGGVGKVFEFSGPGVRALSIDERATFTNMTAELGGLTGIVAPDEQTVAFLYERRGVNFVVEPWMQSDPDAHYDETIELDLATVRPMLARPGDPGRGIAVSDLHEPVLIDIAYGGSCTAGKRDDFDEYHRVLKWGLERGKRLPAGVKVYLQYGTTMVRDYCIAKGYDADFRMAGIRILQPSCGACANCGPGSSTEPSQVTVSAINRNFPGRSGPGQVWLASPGTVMASALAGRLCDFEGLQRIQ